MKKSEPGRVDENDSALIEPSTSTITKTMFISRASYISYVVLIDLKKLLKSLVFSLRPILFTAMLIGPPC